MSFGSLLRRWRRTHCRAGGALPSLRLICNCGLLALFPDECQQKAPST
jgi:hypothetical protein